MPVNGKLEREVAALGDLTREELAERWAKSYGCPPPKGVKRGLLERSAAWHLQAKQLRGLSADARRALGHARRTAGVTNGVKNVAQAVARASDDRNSNTDVEPLKALSGFATQMRAGARLIREWNGRTYVVDVVENGFVMDGKAYRSLSAIARRITGARWSGPRFLGL